MSSSPGLRERHRTETLTVLHEAAAELALNGGLGAATIEAVTDRAGVSKRTFFNYFATKEDAVLGIHTPTVSQEAMDRFLASGNDPFGGAIRLIVEVIGSAKCPQVSREVRRELLRRYPTLKERAAEHMAAAERLVESAIAERAAVGQEGGATTATAGRTDDRQERANRARALVLLAGAVLRFAYWNDPSAMDNPASPNIDEAIAVFRSAIREIS